MKLLSLHFSTVPSISRLHQACPFDEPDGSGTDGDQNELLRRSTSHESSLAFQNQSLLILLLS